MKLSKNAASTGVPGGSGTGVGVGPGGGAGGSGCASGSDGATMKLSNAVSVVFLANSPTRVLSDRPSTTRHMRTRSDSPYMRIESPFRLTRSRYVSPGAHSTATLPSSRNPDAVVRLAATSSATPSYQTLNQFPSSS